MACIFPAEGYDTDTHWKMDDFMCVLRSVNATNKLIVHVTNNNG